MEPKGSDTYENFFSSLGQLITSLEPAIKRAGSVAAAEDILTHLETTDENFHRYDFVRHLRSRIETALGPVIDKELERATVNGDGVRLVPDITEEVLTSQEYVLLQQSILADTKDAVNALIQNFAKNPGHCSEQELGEQRSRYQSMKINHGDPLESSDEESMSSSLGKLRYTFMSHEKFNKIAEDLDPGKPLNVRYEMLSMLYQIPQSDVIASESWAGIRKGLLAALADEDEQMAERSLKFHARMFMTSSAQVTREIYTCLAEHLCLYFSDGLHQMIPIENGLDMSSRQSQRLLKRFRLLNEFQLEVPAYWIRYPERFLEEILQSTFRLLAISTVPSAGSSFVQFMSPLHFLALLDPKATWFKKWMHGNYSRTEVVKQLKLHPSLLVDAVRQCLDFAGTCKTLVPLGGDMMDLGDERGTNDDGFFFTGQDLEYVYVVHSLSLLGRLLLYKDGRALFPVELPDREESVTVHTLLVALIRVMCTPLAELNSKVPVEAQFHPGYIVCDVLGEIASNSEASKECLCKDVITTNLLSPVQSLLDGLFGLDGGDVAAAEMTLLLVADVLATLAVSENGRQQLLYGETQERWQRSRFSPAHSIAQFAKMALSDQLPGGSVPRAVISGFVFVCRQLYNTCEGLIVLNPYGLHRCLANAWSEAHEANALPEGDDSPGSDETPPESTQDQELFAWESSLIDNLLNFAGTPKGLLLLQQTGKMNECVAFMHERYTKKLQVSRCEKFGYGVMVSQIATTAPGMVALQDLGFLKNLVHDVWMVFEGRHTAKLEPPRIKHVDGIDSRMYSKCLNNLLSVLSAFPAVYEVLEDATRPGTSGSEVETISVEPTTAPPTSIKEFIDSFIMLDPDAKVKSLFNFETSHHFGLRVLSVLCSCLDTLLFLECRYKFQEILLEWQLENRLDNGKNYILDMCSLERNYILVRTYFWGGPSERICAGRTLTEDIDNPYPWPLFSSYPPPKAYLPQDQPAEEPTPEQGDDLTEFLQRANVTAADSAAWLEECRDLFCAKVADGNMKGKREVMKLLLQKVCLALINVPDESIFPLIEYSVSETSLKNIELTDVESLGIKLAVRYGVQLKCLESNTDGIEDLTRLLKHTKFFLQGQQKSTNSPLCTLRGDYVGHDWFASTVFLMMFGDPDEAWEFLFKFSSLVSSGYLWVRRLHASVHLPQSLTVSGIPPLYSSTCHNVDLILQAEVPLVYSAFRMSGVTPSQICQHWLRQCFWNYLNWDEICLYIVTCLIMGIDYQVYFCIAIYRHLQQDILQHTQEQDLLIYLKEEPIRDFKVDEHLKFMREMEARHRQTILSDLQNITKA